jgi:hypothetical protein
MTEAEWIACDGEDTGDMHELLTGKGSDRKLRLFACACCRRIWDRLGDERSRRAVEVAERFADGACDQAALTAAWQEAEQAASEVRDVPHEVPDAASDEFDDEYSNLPYNAALAAHWCAIQAPTNDGVAEFASHAAFYAQRAVDPVAECRAQAKLICDVLGGSTDLPRLDPSWLTSDVLALARGIYAEKAFDRMPILADALQDAGCDNAEVLNHCRDANQVHVRGCWVLDLLLGK